MVRRFLRTEGYPGRPFIKAGLWLSVFVATVAFWQADVITGVLFGLYLAWVTVAFARNFSVWSRNPRTV